MPERVLQPMAMTAGCWCMFIQTDACQAGSLTGICWSILGLAAQGLKSGDIQNVLGVLYSSTIFQGNFNYMTVLPVVAYERAVFYRERSASMYAAGPYSSATGKPITQPLAMFLLLPDQDIYPS